MDNIKKIGNITLLTKYDELVKAGKSDRGECEEIREEIIRRMSNGTFFEARGIVEYK